MTHTNLLLIWHTPPTHDEEFGDYEEYEDYEEYYYFGQYEGYKDCGNYEDCKNLKTIVKIVSLWITMMLAKTWKFNLTSAAADAFEE